MEAIDRGKESSGKRTSDDKVRTESSQRKYEDAIAISFCSGRSPSPGADQYVSPRLIEDS